MKIKKVRIRDSINMVEVLANSLEDALIVGLSVKLPRQRHTLLIGEVSLFTRNRAIVTVLMLVSSSSK